MTHALSEMNAELLVREVMRAMLITHSHPDIINGGLAVAYAVRLALQRELPPSMMAGEVLSFIDEDMTARMVRRVKNRLEAGELDIEQTLPGLLSGEPLADSVAAALYIFGATDGDFERGVRAAAALGGEIWNAGSLVGALAGAYGGGSRIPPHLVDGLEGRMYLLMAAPALLRVAQLRGGIFLQLERQ